MSTLLSIMRMSNENYSNAFKKYITIYIYMYVYNTEINVMGIDRV